jgi:DNA-binding NtrC family response regulator
MAKLTVRVPDLDHAIETSVDPGTSVLLGRRPSSADLRARGLAAVQDEIHEVVLESTRVSKSHVLVRSGLDGRITVLDLGSRHGTSIRAAPGAPVTLPGGVDPEIDLAGCVSRGGALPAPPEARWAGAGDFAEGVRRAVQTWLGGSVEVAIGRAPRALEVASFTLADGSELSLATNPAGDTHSTPMKDIIEALRRYVGEQNALLSQEQGHGEGFILASPAIRRAHREVADAAVRGMNVVLIGPNGTGKEELARCYHLHSSRGEKPFVMFRCQNMVGDFGYIDLFGVVRGGAQGVEAREGAVEQANHGTLFLDEVQELRAREQAHLLSFTNYVRQPDGSARRGEYVRMGERDRKAPRYASDVNLVCATLQDLDDPEVRSGAGFREDLWFRLAVRVVRVPPLKDRPEDVRAFLESQPRGSGVKLCDALTPDALALVLRHPWPGNFRELGSFVSRLPAELEPGRVDRAACEEALHQAGRARPAGAPATPAPPGEPSARAFDWAAVEAEAKRLFERDHGGAPAPRQVDRYYQDYLKPVMVVHASGLQEIRELPRVNCSELARRLGFCDGTSVKNHLRRYLELNKG